MPFSTRWLTGALLAGLSSCAAVVPHTLQTPWVASQGETEIGANLGLHGSDLQAAHALTEQVTLIGSVHQRIRSKHGHWAYVGEAGAGYNWQRPHNQRWTLYGGLGYGAGYAYDTFCADGCGSPTSDRVRYGYGFVQPTYRWLAANSRFGLSAAVKVSAVDFLRWQETVSSYPGFPTDSTAGAYPTRTTNRAGYGGIMLQPGVNFFVDVTPRLRLTYSGSLFVPLRRDFPSVLPFAVGIGLQYHVGGAPAADAGR